MTTVDASQGSQAVAGGVPEEEVYRVRSGDTLTAIAEAHGVSLAQLERANPDVHHPDLIRTGQAIRIPPGATAPQSRPSTYTVHSGDTLSGIGHELGLDWRVVAQANHIPTNTHANGGNGTYDDRLVIVDGRTHQAHEYAASTDPISRYEGRYGQDVNGDGRLDLGRLADGTYAFHSSTYDGYAALKPSGNEMVERDTNHDGVFDSRDGPNRIQTAPGASLADYVHIGGRSFTGSAGCLTLPADQHAAFFGALHPGAGIHLVMVNTDRL